LSDAKLRKEIGKRARASAIDRYSTHKIIPKYIEFYERILASDSASKKLAAG
jgi:glycosyltransferase involved in cell wall biosynthesis